MIPLIRPLTPADADDLAAIEQLATAWPWSRQQFADGLVGGEFGWGIEVAGALAGFAIFNRVLDEATLLDMAVHPDRRRQGLARRLLQHALHGLEAGGIARCLLEVRVGNRGAIALYRALGFVEDGLRRHYYPAAAGREDALLMSRPVAVPNDPPLET